MKLLFFTLLFFTYSVKAQLSLKPKEMITVNFKIKTVENIDGNISINSDTTEIDFDINGLKYKEKIGKFSSFIDLGETKVYIYKQEDGILVLQIVNNLLYSLWFQAKNHKLQFR